MAKVIKLSNGGYRSLTNLAKNAPKSTNAGQVITKELSATPIIKEPNIGNLTWAEYGKGVSDLVDRSMDKLAMFTVKAKLKAFSLMQKMGLC